MTERWQDIVAQGPSEEAWEGLWGWLGQQEERDIDVEGLERALEAGGWSDGMRVAPPHALMRLLEGDGSRALRLVRILGLQGEFAEKEVLRRLLRAPVLSGVCGLILSGAEEGNALLRELAKMPEMGRLRYVSLVENGVDWKGLKALLDAPSRGVWEELTLQEKIGEKGAEVLAGAALKGLRVLSLRAAGLDALSCEKLSSAAWLEDVERLDVSENDLDANGLTALFGGKWSRLTTLWAEDLGLEADGMEAWVASLAGRGVLLRELSLCGNPVREQGIAALLTSGVGRDVRILRLAGCEVGGADWSELGKGGVCFETLDLSENQITAASLQSLVASEVRGAKELFLDGHALGIEGVRALAGWKGLSETQFLGLDHGVMGDEGACALGGSPYLGSVRFLRIHGSDVSGKGLRALLGGLDLSRIEGLTLGENPVGKELGAILAEVGSLPKLQELWIPSVGLDGASLRAMKGVSLGGLRRLGLSGNPLGDEGIEVLLGMPWLEGVEELVLQGIGLTEKGARLLAEASRLKRLRVLELGENLVRDRGIQALARSPLGGGLRFLGVAGNPFGKAGEKALSVLWEKGCEIGLGDVEVWEEG